MYDVIVVGMGPGGATAAAHLGRAGFSVLGLEWKPLPRYKVCGGGLSARIDALLDPAYRTVVEDTIFSVRFQFAGTDAFEITSSDPIAYMVMRDRFDAHLAVMAQSAGVQVREDERVLAVRASEGAYMVQTPRGLYRARVIVGADGVSSVVGRSLFPSARGRLTSGFEGEAVTHRRPSSLDAGTILLDIGTLKGGYAWIFPKLGNVSIGAAEFQEGGDRARAGYERFFREEAMLAELTPPACQGHAIPMYAPEQSEKRRLTIGDALLVGDAAHLVDPLFGEGIYYAVLSGRMAAQAIAARLGGSSSDLDAYGHEVVANIYPEFRIAARIAWMLYTFPRVFHRIVRRRPDIIELFYQVLQGRDTYEGFYRKAKGEATESLVSLFRGW
jgi:geranylgeranyl reductase family protein